MHLPVDIEKVKEGDLDAFKSFFVCFYPKLMSLACRFVDEQAAGDLVQDVFTTYWEHKQVIQADNIQAFLYKWIRNNCLNYIKHQTVVSEYEARVRIAEARIAFMENQTDGNDVLKQVMDKDLREIIQESVKKLPPKCAQAFRMCYFHDMTYKEIAEIMEISPRTVEGHVQHAVTFLRKDLRNILTIIYMLYNIN